MIFYVDASVLLRLVLRQPDALAAWYRVDRGFASSLILVECFRTLDRLRLRTKLDDTEFATYRVGLDVLLSSLKIVELNQLVLDRAAQPFRTELGTLDAIHLATALVWKEFNAQEVVMATHDTALATAAQAHGLAVVGVQMER